MIDGHWLARLDRDGHTELAAKVRRGTVGECCSNFHAWLKKALFGVRPRPVSKPREKAITGLATRRSTHRRRLRRTCIESPSR
ncbi:MAG: hypothetical protein ACJ8DO_11645 [Microvirga sp.]